MDKRTAERSATRRLDVGRQRRLAAASAGLALRSTPGHQVPRLSGCGPSMGLRWDASLWNGLRSSGLGLRGFASWGACPALRKRWPLDRRAAICDPTSGCMLGMRPAREIGWMLRCRPALNNKQPAASPRHGPLPDGTTGARPARAGGSRSPNSVARPCSVPGNPRLIRSSASVP